MDATAPHRAALVQRRDDLYETPVQATRALLRVEQLPTRIWEPACGRGAIARVLESEGRTVVATDLVDYGFGFPGVDFLMETKDQADCIVTNPPFKLATEFVRHALRWRIKVCMLLRLAFLEGTGRSDILDGGRLARVHIFRNRLPMMHRDGWQGPRATSTTAYAWFVWDAKQGGPATINRITWED